MTTTAEPRTRPWRAEELASVNGFQCVYSARPGDAQALIRLPGGAAATAGELRARGNIVVPPARPRLEDAEVPGVD